MAWLYLMLAIVFEVSGTTCMKASAGYTKLLPTIGTVAFYIVSFTLLGWALQKIDVGTAYAIWAGLGTVAIAAIGVVWFRESLSWLQIGSIALVALGVVGLNLGGRSLP
ncbi:MAG TPA: multidrug efflux SMR transporter [Pirellulales bacterium]|jgi:small multidrug resistance pump|nr:multidrug efflux SMR transporter [Pirellulales bacterium]